MGSLCNSNNQTTQNYSPNPQAAGLYGDIINRAQQVASQPYTPYGGELVAGVNAQQNTGIAGINAAANQAQPYINTAANYAQQGASAITPGQIQNYSNPYQQDVINATLGNINETNAQQRQALTGNAISSGAFGGDRAGIAQAELARQQGLASNQTLAGLNAQNYTQALGAAQADRAAQGQAAYTFGNLGTTAQGAALQGAGAQVQAGNLQQQTGQAQDTAAYQQYLQQLAFPYQQTQFLAGIGLPAASGLGGTQTTTAPQPSLFSQIAGLGVAGLGLAGGLGYKPFAARGGRIGYASGGSAPFSMIDPGGLGWIPSVQIQGPQQHQFSSPKSPADSTQPFMNGLQTFKSFAPKDMFSKTSAPLQLGADGSYSPSPAGSFDPGTTGGTGMDGFGGLYARGGLIETVHHLRRSLKGNRYADGGDVLSFNDRAQPVMDAINSGTFDPQGSNYTGFMPGSSGTMLASDAPIVPTSVPTVKVSAPMGGGSPSLPPEIMTGQSQPLPEDDGSQALSYDQRSPLAAQSATAPTDQGFFSRLGQKLSDPNVSTSLISAGLGMMAGTSPYGLANIGAGGLKGVQEYNTLQERKQQADLEGKKLAQQLLIHREDLGQRQQQFGNLSAAQKADLAQKQTPFGYSRDKDNNLVPTPNGPHDPATIQAEATAKRLPGMSDEALEKMGDAYDAGFTGVISQIARGTSGPENMNRFWNMMASRLNNRGATGAELAAAKANFTAQSAAAVTAARRESNVSASVEEAKQTFPLALEASAKVPRGQFVPWNKLTQMVASNLSSPEQRTFFVANQGVITAYAQAMARTGVATVDSRHAAEELLRTADSPEAYAAALAQMSKEMHAAEVAPEIVRQKVLERIRGGSGASAPGAAPAAPAAPAVPPGARVGEERQFKQGIGVWNGTAWVPKGTP